jgi:hypothetical protein
MMSLILVSCMLVSVAMAERASQSPGLFAPRVTMSDVPLIAGELDLDNSQTEILRQLFLDYLESFARNKAHVLDQLGAEPPISAGDDPDYRFRREHRDQAPRPAREMDMDDIDEGDIKRAQSDVLAAFNREMEVMEGRQVQSSPRTKHIRAWQNQQAAAWEELLESMHVTLAGTSEGHWPAVVRALRRRNTPWKPLFVPEGVSLGALLYAHFGREHESVLQSFDAIERYDIEFDEALARRDAIMAQAEPLRLDAVEYEYPERMISTSREQIDARMALWRTNEAHIELIMASLPKQDAAVFRQHAMEAMYPKLYGKGRFERAVEYALAESNLTGQQRIDIINLYTKYLAVMSDVNRECMNTMRLAEPEIEFQVVEDMALMQCYRAMFSVSDTTEGMLRLAELMELDQSLTRYHRGQLRAIVGSEEYESWPAFAGRPSGDDPARGPAPDSDADMSVIYMKDMQTPPGG